MKGSLLDCAYLGVLLGTPVKMHVPVIIGAIFAAGGFVILWLYYLIYQGNAKVTSTNLWGYLGGFSFAWASGTIVTVTAVLGLFSWIIFSGEEPNNSTQTSIALSGTALFIGGAIIWPVGILIGIMNASRLGVLFTSVGSILICVYVFELDAPPIIEAAAIWVVIHHSVVDGLWAILPPSPQARQLQFI